MKLKRANFMKAAILGEACVCVKIKIKRKCGNEFSSRRPASPLRAWIHVSRGVE